MFNVQHDQAHPYHRGGGGGGWRGRGSRNRVNELDVLFLKEILHLQRDERKMEKRSSPSLESVNVNVRDSLGWGCGWGIEKKTQARKTDKEIRRDNEKRETERGTLGKR